MSDGNAERGGGKAKRTTRRTVLKAGGALGVASILPLGTKRTAAVTLGSDLTVPKWENTITTAPRVIQPVGKQQGAEYYEIAMTEFSQQVLPGSLPETTVWGYDGSFPGPTIETRANRKVRVKWMNQLGSDDDEHLLTVIPEVHGAKESAPERRTVTHLHGGVTHPESDGYPEAWVSPDGTTDSDSPVPYQQTKEYAARQEAATLWYHDHAIGITRLNVYAGLAGFFIARTNEEMSLNLPSGEYEIPLVIQDRAFQSDGELKYPDEFKAEFFGDVSVVNGLAWPKVEVEPRRYRFRLLNGSNGRFFDLTLEDGQGNPGPLMHQIGADLGFLDSVVPIRSGDEMIGSEDGMESLLMSPAERADVIVDFSGYEGQDLYLANDAETPYAGENSGTDMPRVLRFDVGDGPATDESVTPADLRLPTRKGVPGEVTQTRTFTLDSPEDTSEYNDLDTHLLDNSEWTDPDAVVRPVKGTTEIWELDNTTGDSHPIHLHLVDFEVLGRVDKESGNTTDAHPNERGPKDTVVANPGEITRIKAHFSNFAGRYVWHCHILEHEDQEMMLPYEVVEEPET